MTIPLYIINVCFEIKKVSCEWVAAEPQNKGVFGPIIWGYIDQEYILKVSMNKHKWGDSLLSATK